MTQEILVSAGLDSDLDWATLELPDGDLLWRLDLGLFSLPQPFSEQVQFQSLQLAVQEFVTKLLEPNLSRSKGVILFEGSADFAKAITWHPSVEADYQEWLEEDSDRPYLRSLFSRDLCVDFLELLSIAIPESIPLILRLNGRALGHPIEKATLLSSERFQHFTLEGSDLPTSDPAAPVGFLLPAEEIRSQAPRDALIAKYLELGSSPHRLIPENLLTMEWHELDLLYVSQEGVTPQGERKLQGFRAAGGEVQFVL